MDVESPVKKATETPKADAKTRGGFTEEYSVVST